MQTSPPSASHGAQETSAGQGSTGQDRPPRRRRRLPRGGAIVVAAALIVGVGLLVRSAASSAPVPVVWVAQSIRDIPAGAQVASADVEVVAVTDRQLDVGAVSGSSQSFVGQLVNGAAAGSGGQDAALIGRYAIDDVSAGVQLRPDMFTANP